MHPIKRNIKGQVNKTQSVNRDIHQRGNLAWCCKYNSEMFRTVDGRLTDGLLSRRTCGFCAEKCWFPGWCGALDYSWSRCGGMECRKGRPEVKMAGRKSAKIFFSLLPSCHCLPVMLCYLQHTAPVMRRTQSPVCVCDNRSRGHRVTVRPAQPTVHIH